MPDVLNIHNPWDLQGVSCSSGNIWGIHRSRRLQTKTAAWGFLAESQYSIGHEDSGACERD